MVGLTFLALVPLALGGDDGESYAAAHRATMESGKPMVVMVTTDWCPPCQVMKQTVMPQVKKRGLLRKVAFAILNPDRDRRLADEVTGGGPVPQLVMYHKTSHGWTRRTLIGRQSVEAVEQFINEGLASEGHNSAARQSPSDPATKPAADPGKSPAGGAKPGSETKTG